MKFVAFVVLVSLTAAPALAQPGAGAANAGSWKAMTRTAHSPQMEKELNGITWRCNVNTCYAMAGATAAKVAQMASCQALSQWMGGLTSYSGFSNTQLTQCNAAPPPPAPTIHITPNTIKPIGPKPPIATIPPKPPN